MDEETHTIYIYIYIRKKESTLQTTIRLAVQIKGYHILFICAVVVFFSNYIDL